jgi:hypothetical protein
MCSRRRHTLHITHTHTQLVTKSCTMLLRAQLMVARVSAARMACCCAWRVLRGQTRCAAVWRCAAQHHTPPAGGPARSCAHAGGLGCAAVPGRGSSAAHPGHAGGLWWAAARRRHHVRLAGAQRAGMRGRTRAHARAVCLPMLPSAPHSPWHACVFVCVCPPCLPPPTPTPTPLPHTRTHIHTHAHAHAHARAHTHTHTHAHTHTHTHTHTRTHARRVRRPCPASLS